MSCAFADFRLHMSRGDDKEFRIFVRDPDTEEPVPLAGWTGFLFTGKLDPADADVDAQFQLSLGDGLTVSDEDGGEIDGLIEASLTSALTEDTLIYCDFQGVNPSGRLKTIMRGLLDVCVDITIATS